MKRLPLRNSRLIVPLCFLILALCTRPHFGVLPVDERGERLRAARAQAENAFVNALDLERRGYDREAMALLTKAHELDPTSETLRDLLIRRYLDAGSFADALQLLIGDKKESMLTTGEKRMAAELYLKSGASAKAVAIVESIPEKEPRDYYLLALIYESMQEPEKSLRCYIEFFHRADEPFALGLKIVQMELALRHPDPVDTMLAALQARYGEKPELFSLRGLRALSQKDTAAALVFFNKATALDSSFEDGARYAAMLYMQRADYAKAIRCFETLYHNSTAHKDAWGRSLAVACYYNKQFERAADLITALLEHDIDDPELHFYLGSCIVGQNKDPVAARLEFEKAIALKDDFMEAWEQLYYAAAREKDLDGVLAIARRFTGRWPESDIAWRLEGSAHTMRKEYALALPAFRKSVALDTTDPSGWYDLGSCLERLGDISHAAEAFGKVLKLKPGDPATCNYLGYMWAERGIKLDSAKALLEQALSREPNNGAYLDSYAWVFYQMGDLQKAGELILKAIARIHNDPDVFEHLGDILSKRGDLAGAAEAYGRSLEYNSDNGERIRRKIITIETILRAKEPR